ncbi:MAG: hypothetical protein WKH97_16675 [Casimicrobiaceae bacterium]
MTRNLKTDLTNEGTVMGEATPFHFETKEYGNIQNAVDYFLKFEIERNKKILDIGTNLGSFPHALHMRRGYKNVHGIDIREHAIKYGQQHYPLIRDSLSCYDGHAIHSIMRASM